MKSAVLAEPNVIEIQQQPDPVPREDQVLIRVRAVGICGSDTHYFAGWRDHEPSTVYPFVLGHEFAGEVAALGSDVEGVEEGMRVLCAPDLPCGSCEWCKKGKKNICPNVRFAGSGGVNGCLSEYYTVHHSQLHPIPDSLGFAEATLSEPLAIGLHIIDNLIAPAEGEDFAVIGAGPIGLVSAFGARLRGAGEVLVSDRIRERTEAAVRYGAGHVCLVGNESDFEDFVSDRTGGRGVDAVVEAGGEKGSITQAPRLACIHGRVVIEGIPPDGYASFDVDAARRRELEVVFGRRSLNKTDEALDLIASGEFDAEGMITHEFPLEGTQDALECCRDYRDGVLKAVVFP